MPYGRPLLDLAVIATAIITAGSGLYYLKSNYPLLIATTKRSRR
jgi:hypothetical protein